MALLVFHLGISCRDSTTMVDKVPYLKLDTNQRVRLEAQVNSSRAYLKWRINDQDTIGHYIYADTLFEFKKKDLEQAYFKRKIRAYPSERKGIYLNPIYNYSDHSIYSLSAELGNQKLAIHNLEDASFRTHILPQKINGYQAYFALNDLYPPIVLGDSLILLNCNFPNLGRHHQTKELYSLGIDAVFKLKEDSLVFKQLIGMYPAHYQNSVYILNDFHPSRSAARGKIYYGFKYSNRVYYYEWNTEQRKFTRHILKPNKLLNVSPLEVLSSEEFNDGRSSKKQFEEPGFLDLEIDESDGSIYRIYRAPDSITDYKPRRDLLYKEDFYLLKYDSSLQFIKAEYQSSNQVIMNLQRNGSLFWFNAVGNSNVYWLK
ncbi:hypothetical protein [Croceimicrobium hydrocarbonivorans]|uniref:Uncharacterized protein n=1 Tax=Croceimicrobium hydrocarbonivorans TaxID=2761580 RepID=A0A7H0VH89_9FLAO|nr:hypothetical protein [Croceimicrobium hydrocarbonivorans]QNR25087.1 hypothetical protein H4K34_04405 [Croceimicrobium hydrocarbonivorans]